MEKAEYIRKLKKKFLKLKIEIKDLLNNIDTSRHTHLQNYIYFAHHPVFSFTESIIILCENRKSHVAKVLLRALFEAHIDIIYHQFGNSEQRLAFSAKRMFCERITILEEILNLIKRYPNLESTNQEQLFNKKYLERAIGDQKIHKEAILKGNPDLKGTKSLQEKAKLCEKEEVKNSEKGHFERMYSLIYRQLSPVAHLNIEGFQEFIGKDEYGKIFFHDGDDGDFVATEAVKICLAFTKDLYDNKILTGDPIQIIDSIEKLILR
ncbi:MAG: hypothetical protein UW81_C0008G0006 [Candidatus Giovannonibacteria bacterium GW2011_GWC2_44_9]|uniref:Uncharacterized protein n=3 Tax=Candidatus Giovannoniibacteriota TaxID=1752738 RepID=A0A0G1IYS6_9BACT|nr:MAG: hypothetical protein UW49_C0002G0065 [Candidatus Giovannonibacteria bacterium GW2011_GWB1_44_23]KKT64185.1 MAG: hypothetical protein UW57_C0002G0065 [Candidatus Giovannonibacteria bacterium GW2011_GWA1_44_29]KKT83943.1 MAG: hypothetical protein UW81_C0008G0006 [Candidatus Giovannonibacteria bacterium GW2011_GWC2_44_9]KKT91785.1 MAG: hypothetical protein UW93_C0003G0065 [Parcubacteria group bacterium GW2011_GWC1_45_13]